MGRAVWKPLSIGLLLISLIACSEAERGQPEPPEEAPEAAATETPRTEDGLYALGRDPLYMTFYAHYGYYTMPKWGADPSSAWIRDKLNVHVKGVSAEGDGKLMLQKMVAGQQLPDVVWGERDADLERLREAGLLVPLDEYIAEYPNLRQWAGEKIINLLRSPDGHIYYFPNYYSNKPYGNAGFVVNKRIYRELGSPKLETTDDLYRYLLRVKTMFPDAVPFETGLAKEGQGIDQLFSSFKEDNFSFTRYFAVANGERMTSIYKDAGFRESAMFVAKLMREGLMSQDALVQTEYQVSEKLMAGKAAVYASADPMRMIMIADAELSKADPEDGYFFIEPIYKEGLDPARIYPGTYNVLGWNAAAITTSANNPEAIFALLDWMTGPEGSAVQMWGPPGEDGYWNGFKEDGITPAFTSKYSSDPQGLAEIQALSGDMIWVGNTGYLDKTKSEYEATLPEEDRNWATYWQQNITWRSQGDATPFIKLIPPSSIEEGRIYLKLKEIWLDARATAMFGRTDEEVLDVLDDAHAASMEAGFDLYLDYITKRWQDNLRVLNND
ncbi:extracellular solute-binding protein [Paenibacillus sp. PAMC21692]|uniref:extracellular solute-binding protein n=1 Tax=Paenibacillus sp. PAMC21692 TaxID=2762320 RepID=UPI00164E3271|nr:extracellular solute-binding protein [Paenibacillus sp. PAMC21692]QNK60829.1 extracellular solute-binding protein [Paenibacillus sp. PAMC21692]